MDKKDFLLKIQSTTLAPKSLLPHNLENEALELLTLEAEAISKNPNQENVAECFVNIIIALSAVQGNTKVEHSEIADKIAIYLKILSLEKLKRAGLIKHYETPDIKNIFDTSREFDVTLNTPR